MNWFSGSELLLAQMLPVLAQKKIEVAMLVIHKTTDARRTNKRFVDTLVHHHIRVFEIYGHHPLSPALHWKIRRVLKEGRYDIAHCNLPHADFWMAVQKCFFFRKLKLVSVKHGFDELLLAKYTFRIHKLSNSVFAWAQRVTGLFIKTNVAISGFIYDLYVKGRISKKRKIRVVYNGMNFDRQDTSAFERKIHPPYAVIVGRLVKYKGHEYLINAWRLVREYNPEFKLAILGQGAYQEELKQLVRDQGLEEQVIFTGYENPHPYFNFSSFSVVSSLCEPFGLILLESWHHKKAVVAFNVPAINEVVDNNVNGILVPPFDINELARKIIYMFEHKDDTDSMGERGYSKLNEKYNLERMVTEYIEIYNDALTAK
jgi:glycosyltransferase involved in cell wall biosynthesis